MNKTKSKKLVNSLRHLVDSIEFNENGTELLSLSLKAGFTGDTLYKITQILKKNNIEFQVLEQNDSCTHEIETDIDCNESKIMVVKNKIFVPELPSNFILIVVEHEKCYKLARDMGDNTFIDTNIILGVDNYQEALDMALDMIEVLGDSNGIDDPLYVSKKL